MAAFVAAILAQASDRTPWLAAILATRFQRPAAIIAGTALALALINGIGAVGGAAIGPRLVPEARSLLLALALLSAGGSALFAIKPPDRLSGWRIGGFLTSLFGIAILGFGDRTQFITAALGARNAPILAAIGATLGALVVNVPAIIAGEAGRQQLPLTAIRLGAASLFLVAGAITGLGAIGLI